ncbi:MAG: diguanylate cyclase, partial [Treponema sp.]|nr:diguanylate cyclase [Treponema sp.]
WNEPLPIVTVSVGVYTFDQNTPTDVSSIIRRADEALYISKKRGRNCCTMWNSSFSNSESQAYIPVLEVV